MSARDGRLRAGDLGRGLRRDRRRGSRAPSRERIGAIAGDLAAVEEMFALKLLMDALGSPNHRLPPGRRQRSIRRSAARSYLFNPTIAGIEQADAILIVGSNPRHEAAVLNARIRKRWRQGDVPDRR